MLRYLAVDGGLDYQRNEQVKAAYVENKMKDKGRNSNEERIKFLQKKINEPGEECCLLKGENEKLKSLKNKRKKSD